VGLGDEDGSIVYVNFGVEYDPARAIFNVTESQSIFNA
jgi:hypothetical protein